MNRTLHGRSRFRPNNVDGHNVFYLYSQPGRNDALDIFGEAGEPVFAIHSGWINRLSPNGSRACLYIKSKHIMSVYAHLVIMPNLRFGQHIEEGQVIGHLMGPPHIKDPHLHLEIVRDGEPLVGRTPSSLADKMKRVWSPQ